jgi:hypothetical protein
VAPPLLDNEAELLLGADAHALGLLFPFPGPRLQSVAADRTDLAHRAMLKAGSTLELGYQPATHLTVTWFELQCNPFSLTALERVFVESITFRGDEQLMQRTCLLHLMGRQNESLLRFPTSRPGEAIRVHLKNESDTDLDVELRLHGVEPVQESESA